MKKKQRTYLLLVLVIGIWGMIAYQVITGLSPTNTEVSPNTSEVKFQPLVNLEKDTFSISKLERDPFLGKIYRKKNNVVKKAPKKEVSWPVITYLGMIKKNTNENMSVYVFTIAGTQVLMKPGQKVQDVKLIKANEQEASVQYQGERKTLSL